MWLLHSFVTVWNDMADAEDDAQNGINRIENMVAIPFGGAGLRAGQSVTGVGIAIVLLLVASAWLIGLAAAYLLVGWLYNSRPLRLSKRPIGSMSMMALGYGALPFLIGASLGGITVEALVIGGGWAVCRLSLSLLKDYKDAPGDARTSKKTFLLVFGARTTARASVGFLVGGLAVIITACYAAAPRIDFTLAILPIAGWIIWERGQLFIRDTYRELHAVFRNGLRYQIILDGAFIAWLLS